MQGLRSAGVDRAWKAQSSNNIRENESNTPLQRGIWMKVKDNVDIKVFFFVLGEKHSKHRKDHLNHRSELLNSKRFLLDT